MKKKEYYLNLYGKNIGLLRCPVCGGAFGLESGSLICSGRHCFDIGANGAVNLLYPPKKLPKMYSKSRMLDRRDVIEAGFFDPVLCEIAGLLPSSGENVVVADLGCGEGSMLRRLSRDRRFLGIGADISKDAIAVAASGDASDILWLVSDLADLPLSESCADAVLNILSPAAYAEFDRVLKPGGLVIKVIPGKDYLREVRDMLFEGRKIDEGGSSALLRKRDVVFEKKISYAFSVEGDVLGKVFGMTPLTEGRNFSDAMCIENLRSVTVELEIFMYKKSLK